MHHFGMLLFDSRKVAEHSDYYKLLRTASRRHISLIINSVCVLFFGGGLFLLYPVYLYFHGERPPLVPVEIIGIDNDTVHGYYINIGFQAALSVICLLGIVAMDVFFIELLSIYSLGNDLIAHNCDLLNGIRGNAASTRIEKILHLRNIIIQIQDNDGYVVAAASTQI